MTRDGYRYSILTEEDGSVRFVASESGIAKEVQRNPFGGIIYDSDPSFWIPFGLKHGTSPLRPNYNPISGVDLPDLSIAILNGRPYDHISGRYMSFGPADVAGFSISKLPQSLDLFSLELETATNIPLGILDPFNLHSPSFPDIPRWFSLIGLSPRVLPSVHLPPLGSSPISTRSFGSLPSKLRLFSSPVSVFPSSLLESSQTRIVPEEPTEFFSDDYSFSDLFLLAPGSGNTVQPFPKLARRYLSDCGSSFPYLECRRPKHSSFPLLNSRRDSLPTVVCW